MYFIGYLLSFALLLASLQGAEEPSLEEVKDKSVSESKYLSTTPLLKIEGIPEADLKGFKTHIEPILASSCVECTLKYLKKIEVK